jgi:hypothetical protein
MICANVACDRVLQQAFRAIEKLSRKFRSTPILVVFQTVWVLDRAIAVLAIHHFWFTRVFFIAITTILGDKTVFTATTYDNSWSRSHVQFFGRADLH